MTMPNGNISTYNYCALSEFSLARALTFTAQGVGMVSSAVSASAPASKDVGKT